jgi:transposase
MTLNRVPADHASYESSCECGCRVRERRYPTDLTDGQWAVLEPLLPVMLCLTAVGGRPEKHHRRAVMDALFYVVDNGIKWRALPGDFPPWRTIYGFCRRWRADRVLAGLADDLRAKIRAALGRDPEPSAAIADSQSVAESAEGVVPAATSGYDGHKRVNGRKRHLLVDVLGLLIAVVVTPANTQDRDAAVRLARIARARGRRLLQLIWADSAYEGAWTGWAQHALGIIIQIVRRRDDVAGFKILPRRWVVERTNAWITRRRRCARDYERLPTQHAAMVELAAILMMTRRLAKIAHASQELQKQAL